MKQNTHLSDALHVLLHLAQAQDALTSEVLATAMATHPVVLRRLMAGLRNAGVVASGKGHGGGWAMAAELKDITLQDVHEALGSPALVSLGFRDDRPECLVAQTVNDSLQNAVRDAEALLQERFASVTLADLERGIQQRLDKCRRRHARPAHLLKDHHAHD